MRCPARATEQPPTRMCRLAAAAPRRAQCASQPGLVSDSAGQPVCFAVAPVVAVAGPAAVAAVPAVAAAVPNLRADEPALQELGQAVAAARWWMRRELRQPQACW